MPGQAGNSRPGESGTPWPLGVACRTVQRQVQPSPYQPAPQRTGNSWRAQTWKNLSQKCCSAVLPVWRREAGQLLETWIVMEYADRGNLADALRSGRFPCHDFVAVYRCLLDIAAGSAQLFLVDRAMLQALIQKLMQTGKFYSPHGYIVP